LKIWLTGSTGSLGCSLLETLKNAGFGTILAPTRGELDLENHVAVSKYIQKHKPSHVFHLAAKVYGIAGHKENPQGSLVSNTRIDNAVFSALFEAPPQWIYYASTVAAYGYPYLSLPLKESDFLIGKPHESEAGYAISKRFALNYLEILRREHEIKFAYALTTNLFGSGDRFLEGRGHVVVSLLEKAKRAREEGKVLEVWGTGAASRDFLSTNDASRLIVSLMDRDVGVINIASGEEITIAEIAEEIVREFEILEGYRFVGLNEGITNRVCSVEKLQSVSEVLKTIDSRRNLKEQIALFAKSF
jgi:GDP-L-fucose synthase